MLWVVDLILGGSAAAGNWCHSVACRWLLFTCHLAPPATAAAAAVPVADADAPMAMPRLRLLLKLKPSCHIRRCCEASMLWNFASASAVCSLFPVCRLQSEAVAVVIAARSVSITMVVFVVCFFAHSFVKRRIVYLQRLRRAPSIDPFGSQALWTLPRFGFNAVASRRSSLSVPGDALSEAARIWK